MSVGAIGPGGAASTIATVSPASTYSDDVQTINIAGNGTFQLSFNGQTTGTISTTPASGLAAAIQSALQQLVGANNIVVNGPFVTGNTESLNVAFVGTFAGQGQGVATLGVVNAVSSSSSANLGVSVYQSYESVQSVNIAGASVGTFTLAFNGATTGSLPSSASTVQVAAALQGLATIGSGTIVASGNANDYYQLLYNDPYDNTPESIPVPMNASASSLQGLLTASLFQVPAVHWFPSTAQASSPSPILQAPPRDRTSSRSAARRAS